jgi:hypothetical protein
MPEDEARRALSREVTTPARMEAQLTGLLESDALATWAEEALVFDPEAVARVGTADGDRETFLLPHYRAVVEGDGGRPLSGKNFKTALVGLLRDSLGLPLPPGPLTTGRYRERGVGSLIPCIRFRTAADGDAPGVVRYAYQTRMCSAEHGTGETPVGNGSAETGTAAERQEPSQGTDVTDGTDKRPQRSHARARAHTHGGVCGDRSVTSVPSVPAQGSIHVATRSASVPTRSAPPDPKHLRVGSAVEVLQRDGTWRNGYRVASQPKDGRVLVSSEGGSLLRPLDQVRLWLAL